MLRFGRQRKKETASLSLYVEGRYSDCLSVCLSICLSVSFRMLNGVVTVAAACFTAIMSFSLDRYVQPYVNYIHVGGNHFV